MKRLAMFTSKQNKILLLMIAIGLAITSFGVIYYYLPVPPTEDADLGGAAFLIIGVPILLVGVIALSLSLILSQFTKYKQVEFSFRRLLSILIVAVIIYNILLAIALPLLNIGKIESGPNNYSSNEDKFSITFPDKPAPLSGYGNGSIPIAKHNYYLSSSGSEKPDGKTYTVDVVHSKENITEASCINYLGDTKNTIENSNYLGTVNLPDDRPARYYTNIRQTGGFKFHTRSAVLVTSASKICYRISMGQFSTSVNEQEFKNFLSTFKLRD